MYSRLVCVGNVPAQRIQRLLAKRPLPNGQYRPSEAAALRASAARARWIAQQSHPSFWASRSFVEVDRAVQQSRLAQRASAPAARLRAPCRRALRAARTGGRRPIRVRRSRSTSRSSASSRSSPSSPSGSTDDPDGPHGSSHSSSLAVRRAFDAWFFCRSDAELRLSRVRP